MVEKYAKAYQALLKVNRPYRKWLNTSPSVEDINTGKQPNAIAQLLLDTIDVRSLLDDSIQDFIEQYPGSEKA